ncbi:MAG: hydantoinase B/oxoprolinase family protein [Halobacteriales archaeon]|nr:hydantoinase B/oxoprolinase family protein [Halobacteriales archaeon]
MASTDSNRTDVDPVTLEVLWNQLRAIPQEMGSHLRRTAFSPVIKYAQDFSTGLFSWDGRLVSQGVYTAGHLGSMPISMRRILEDHFGPDDWNPGDVVLTNNPYINSGHLPDFFTFEPVFLAETLVGFCVTTGHQNDVGGAAPGSQPMRVKDMFGEGIEIPPIKVYKKGDPDTDVIDLILQNSRTPTQLHGDIRAHRGASKVGTDLYRDLVTEFGFDAFQRYVDEIIDRTEATFREAIREAPDGTHAFEDVIEGFEEPLPIRVTMTIEDDEIYVDFTGTAPQQPGFSINTPSNYAHAYTLLSVKTAIDPETPPTHGMMEPVTLHVPEGTLLNPTRPMPVASRQLVARRIVGTVNGALHGFVPGRVPADGSQLYWYVMEFEDPDSEEGAILQDGVYGGAGAGATHDGTPPIAAATNVSNTPVEAIEAAHPIRIHAYELMPDTGGAGTHRGGPGTVRRYEFLQGAAVQALMDRFETPPWGLEGGEDGTGGRAVHFPTEGEERALHSKEGFTAEAGDMLELYTAGGGGYGPPSERNPDAIRRDVQEELVSAEWAEARYGPDWRDGMDAADGDGGGPEDPQ